MTEDEYKGAVSAVLREFGMNFGAPACPHEKGKFFRSPKVEALLVLEPEHLDELQRPVAVDSIREILTAAHKK